MNENIIMKKKQKMCNTLLIEENKSQKFFLFKNKYLINEYNKYMFVAKKTIFFYVLINDRLLLLLILLFNI